MDKTLQGQLEEKLRNKKIKLVDLLEKMTNQKTFNKNKIQVKLDNMGDKDEDNAMEVANFQDNISLERELEVNLEKIEAALVKIDKDEYGECIKCQTDIKEERLLAYPEAEICLKCAAGPKS
ncbi:MAG: TraR/DksA C4-type zinc finger protein [candidate division Zixibacteria bacterium]|nr:TraR/DksA C4-type zinc finger protein [candidate division Zixibacteria bacterium]